MELKGILSIRTLLGVLMLVLVFFIAAGCSQGTAENSEPVDKNAEAIKAVIEKEFNGPDEKYRELWEEAMATIEGDMNQEEYDAAVAGPEHEALKAYSEETYASLFTENGFDDFITTGAFHYSLFEGAYGLSTSDIEITQNDQEPTLYTFTFDVLHEDEPFTFEGKAMVPEDGKIGRIQFMDKDGLAGVIQGI